MITIMIIENEFLNGPEETSNRVFVFFCAIQWNISALLVKVCMHPVIAGVPPRLFLRPFRALGKWQMANHHTANFHRS
jgi:hypothetical protein